MEGRGEFTHSSGRQQKGIFRRNYIVCGDCMINPLDDAAQQAKTITRLMQDVYIGYEKIELKEQMQLFRVHQTQDLLDGL